MRGLLGFLFACFCAGAVKAVEVPDLYVGVVPVPDQNEPTRKKAEAEAMRQVLVKVSGSEQVLAHALVQESFNKSSSFIQTYQFKRQEWPFGVQAPVDNALLLEARFDQKAIDRLIQSVAAPIWGKRRPISIFWLAVSDEAGRRIIGDDNEPMILHEMQTAARDKGVPALVPLLDLEETTTVNISDVWGRFVDPLLPVSQRYGTDAVVVGKVEQLGGAWSADFTVMHGQFRESFSVSAASRGEIFTSVFASLASFYASKYAVVVDLSKDERQWVKVHKVFSVTDYGKIVNFLSTLQAVQQVDVVRVSPGELLLSVRLIADQSAFLQALALDQRFILNPESSYSAELEFDWRPM